MDKTMTRFLAILAALTCAASAQTYRTVTADTNNVIRTNFSLVRSQVSDLSGASFAISNVTGLQTALDGKLATNGSAAALTNFPASILQTNSSASLFPSALLRTNGDGSGLTNLPNANLSNAIGVLPIANGGSGATNAAGARTAFGLGSAATNDASAFQPASSALTNLSANNGGSLTNIPFASVVGLGSAASNAATAFQPASTNLDTLASNNAANLTNFSAIVLLTNSATSAFPSFLLRTNGDGSGLSNVSVDLTAVLPAYSNNAGKVLAVATGATNVEWVAVSNTVTDASSLTNYPAYLLQTNGSAAGLTNFPSELLRTNGSAAALTSFPSELLRTNGSASALTNFPTLNQNTTGTASNVTGVVQITNGGTGTNSASGARVNLLPSYTGNASRVLALNSNATDVVWAVDGGGTVDLASTNVTGTLPVARGGTGATNGQGALTNFGIYDASQSVFLNFANNPGANAYAVVIGQGAAIGTIQSHVAIGRSAVSYGTNGGVAIGRFAVATNYATAIGSEAKATNLGTAIGILAKAQYGAAVGYNSTASWTGGAIGYEASAVEGFSGGNRAVATQTNGSQIGNGTNTNDNSIQFMSAGSVDTNEWTALATLSTQGRYAMTNTNGISGTKTFVAYDGTNYTTNSVTISNGIITGWTP